MVQLQRSSVASWQEKREGPAHGAFEIWGCEEGFLKPIRMYEALTMPSAVPALGHDVSTDCRTHSVDLSAQKLSLFAPDHGMSIMSDSAVISLTDRIAAYYARGATVVQRNVDAAVSTVNHDRVTHIVTTGAFRAT
jgi:hypothetical protein